MGAWVNLLPKAEPPERASDVYSTILKQQALRQKTQQDQAYNQARIAEQTALAAQHQRVNDAKNALAGALSKNTVFNPDGTVKINYAGAVKDANESGFGDLTPDLLKEAAERSKTDLDLHGKKAEYIGNLAGSSYRVQNWDDPNEVARARTEALNAIDQGVRDGHIDPQDAQAQRAAAANYNQEYQSRLDQYSSFGKTLGNHIDQSKKSLDLLVDQLTSGSKVDKSKADASLAQTNAAKAQLGLAGQVDGVYPTNSEIGGNAPQAANPYLTPPGAAPASDNVSGSAYNAGAYQAQGPYTEIPGIERGGFTGRSDMKRDANGNIVVVPRDGNRAPAAAPAETRDLKWTPEKQAAWEAKRKQFPLAAPFMPPEYSPKAAADLKIHALTPEQQVMKLDRENKPANEDKELKSWATRLGAAADIGPGSYARALAGAPKNIQDMFPDPDKWDSAKTPRQIRMFGMTGHEQESVGKPSSADAVAARFSQRELDEGNKTHNELQLKEQEKWRVVGQYGEMLKPGPDGKPKSEAIDPLHPEKTADMANPETRAFYQNQYNAARTEAEQLAKQQKDIRQRFGGGEFAPGAQRSSAAPAKAEAPTAPPVERLKEGFATRFKNGQVWTLRNGKPTLLSAQQ